MKILVLTPDIYTRGGIARYTWTLASAAGDCLGAEAVRVLPLLNIGGETHSPHNFRILDAIASRLTPEAKARYAMKALWECLSGCDLTICTHISFGPIAATARTLFGTPYWIAGHGMEVWNRLHLPLRVALQKADLVLAVSRYTAQRVIEVNGVPPTKLRVLPNAIPDSFAGKLEQLDGHSATGGLRGNRRTLLSVGTVSRDLSYKGFETVVRALPSILRVFPDVHYVIVGAGNDRGPISRLATESGVESHVEFAGEVSDDGLAAFYRACDLFVLASRAEMRNGRWQGEGFGRVYIEAARAGKPVVGSTHGGASEAVIHGKTGLLVDPDSAADIANAVLTLLRKPDLADRMGKAGQCWARDHFSEKAMRESLGRILDELLGPRQKEPCLCAESSE